MRAEAIEPRPVPHYVRRANIGRAKPREAVTNNKCKVAAGAHLAMGGQRQTAPAQHSDNTRNAHASEGHGQAALAAAMAATVAVAVCAALVTATGTAKATATDDVVTPSEATTVAAGMAVTAAGNAATAMADGMATTIGTLMASDVVSAPLSGCAGLYSA